MNDIRTAMIEAHQRNLSRYARLLTTDLTSDERTRIHRLIAQEHNALELLGAPLTEEELHVPVWTPPPSDIHVT